MKPQSKLALCATSVRCADEFRELLGDRLEIRLVAQELVGQPVHEYRFRGNRRGAG